MNLTPEQQELVRAWAAQGESISGIQTRLASECGVHLSYMDTRFLLIDLSVSVAEKNAKKEPPPAPVPAPEPEPEPDGYGAVPPLPGRTAAAEEEPELPPSAEEPAAPADAGAAGSVQVDLARIQRPGFAASGSITCSDGVKGEWGIDAYGRLALAFPDNKGYRPTPADQQAFMEKLRSLLSAGY